MLDPVFCRFVQLKVIQEITIFVVPQLSPASLQNVCLEEFNANARCSLQYEQPNCPHL